MTQLRNRLVPLWGRARSLLLALVLISATIGLALELNHHYAISHWLFWSYLGYASVALAFNLACFSVGFATLKWLVPRGMSLRERALIAMALGVLIFYLGAFVLGWCKAYGPVYFVAYPLVLFATGTFALWHGRKPLQRWLRCRPRLAKPWSVFEQVAFAGGVLALAIVYAGVMVPENTAFDARWYHLPIAEHYAARGGIEPFVEGWYQGALPHLSSFIYTWVMLMPVGDLVDKVITCAHVEFSLFLWTLWGIPCLVRWVLPSANARMTWVATFLFPGILLYDSSLSTTADHIAAFWAIPVFLACVRALRTLDLRRCLLFGALLAAPLSTKYQAMSLVTAPVLAIMLRWVFLVARARGNGWARLLIGPVLAAAAATLVFAPHWLKNLLWYGDPAYPWMHKYFDARIWSEETVQRLAIVSEYHLWQPKGTTLQKLWETTRAMWEFPFKPHNWYPMHRDWPVFGSLFTLLSAALPFIRAPRRVWALFGACALGVFTWYWMSHQDRYLQALVPLLAAFVAATIIIVWRSGLLARLTLVPLVGLQVLWGGDVPFYGHSQLGRPPIQVAVDRVASGFHNKRHTRSAAFDPLAKVGEYLPKGAKVLMHEEQSHLGLQTMAVVDWPEWQGGLSYGRFRSPAAMHDRLLAYGVTHIVMVAGRSRDVDTLPGDVVYFDYVTNFAKPATVIGPWTVLAIPENRPPDTPYRKILWLGLENLYDRGLYDFAQMSTMFISKVPKSQVARPVVPVNPERQAELVQAIQQADAVAVDLRANALPWALLGDFTRVTQRAEVQLWLRRRGTVGRPAQPFKFESIKKQARPAIAPTPAKVANPPN